MIPNKKLRHPKASEKTWKMLLDVAPVYFSANYPTRKREVWGKLVFDCINLVRSRLTRDPPVRSAWTRLIQSLCEVWRCNVLKPKKSSYTIPQENAELNQTESIFLICISISTTWKFHHVSICQQFLSVSHVFAISPVAAAHDSTCTTHACAASGWFLKLWEVGVIAEQKQQTNRTNGTMSELLPLGRVRGKTNWLTMSGKFWNCFVMFCGCLCA